MRTAPTDLGTSCPKVEQGKRAAPPKVPPPFVSPRDKGNGRYCFSLFWKEAHMEDPVPVKEEYTYQVGKITFIVTPVYKDKGESMRDILLKLMLADLEPV